MMPKAGDVIVKGKSTREVLEVEPGPPVRVRYRTTREPDQADTHDFVTPEPAQWEFTVTLDSWLHWVENGDPV